VVIFAERSAELVRVRIEYFANNLSRRSSVRRFVESGTATAKGGRGE
jgi:hypothetical protein